MNVKYEENLEAGLLTVTVEKISEPGRPPTKEKSKTSTRATSKKKKKV